MNSKSRNILRSCLELSKLKIMIPVSLTGFTGYFIFDSHITVKIILLTFGILVLAVSASVLNQIQEAGLDSKMKRTYHRPLPGGRIPVQNAYVLFFVTFLSGICFIYFFGNFAAASIGLFTLLWYNGIYTNAKRITAFAVFPGAITGALPPLIGWVAAGGGFWDRTIVFVEFLFFIGQVPHFWLLILKYGEEYEMAGIPSLTGILTRSQIYRLTFTWVVTSVISAFFLCRFGIIKSEIIITVLVIASAILIWNFSGILKTPVDKNNFRKYSVLLDLYFFLVLLLLISDRLITTA
jgi:heme o synthase